jgi:hypothetical protein
MLMLSIMLPTPAATRIGIPPEVQPETLSGVVLQVAHVTVWESTFE